MLIFKLILLTFIARTLVVHTILQKKFSFAMIYDSKNTQEICIIYFFSVLISSSTLEGHQNDNEVDCSVVDHCDVQM